MPQIVSRVSQEDQMADVNTAFIPPCYETSFRKSKVRIICTGAVDRSLEAGICAGRTVANGADLRPDVQDGWMSYRTWGS